MSTAHIATDIRIFHKECRSLAKGGYDVALIAMHPRDEVLDGVKVKALDVVESRVRRITVSVWKAYREAARQNADLYHFHDPELIPACLLLRMRGKQIVYDAHEDVPNTVSYKSYLPAWTRQPLQWFAGRIENLSVRCFAGVVAATPEIAAKLRTQNANTVVVRNYPLLEEFADSHGLPWNHRSPLVVHIGASMNYARGFREAVKAMSLLPAALEAKLAFAGDFAPELKLEATRSGRVELLGYVGRAEVAELLGRARVGLDLVHPVRNYLRALPTKLFEYMCAGIPAVVSDLPSRREIVENAGCGLLVNPMDPKQIASAIEYLLTHPDEGQRMGERGRAAVQKNYKWDAEALKLLAFYESLSRSVPNKMFTSVTAPVRDKREAVRGL
jgi:glycosyltransferase involved in cell wall biosynthesis